MTNSNSLQPGANGSAPPIPPTTLAIRELNDAFRRSLTGGIVHLTRGIHDRPDHMGIVHRVRVFETFDADNDPYQEHDFGSFNWHDNTIFWKIDYYDLDLNSASPDPSDREVTRRVLTIMLASEY